MTDDLDLEGFLQAERAGAADAAGQDAARARLALALGPVAFGLAAAGAAAAPATPAGSLANPAAAAAAPAKVVWGIARYKVGLLLAGGFAIGVAAHAALGVVTGRMAAPHEAPSATPAGNVAAPLSEPVVPSPAFTPAPADSIPLRTVESLPASPGSLGGHPQTPGASAAVPTTTQPSARPDSRDNGGLAAEHVLLETARTALERGDAANAMAALDRHAQRFPGGQLREERESLAVYALVAEARMEEARARTAAFHRAFPTSLQGPALDTLMSGSP